jgi:hypothetical protein
MGKGKYPWTTSPADGHYVGVKVVVVNIPGVLNVQYQNSRIFDPGMVELGLSMNLIDATILPGGRTLALNLKHDIAREFKDQEPCIVVGRDVRVAASTPDTTIKES